MATYRELLAAGQGRDRRDLDVGRRATRLDGADRPLARRRAGAGRVAGGSPAGRDPRPARQSRVAHRGPCSRQGPRARRLLRRRLTLGIRRQVARRARVRRTSSSMAGASPTGSATATSSRPARRCRAEQRARYSRHILIPEVGEEGQQKLLDARVLLIGAGGLGSPASLYLAAAGVGTLGIVDADVVDDSNLQRQIVHSTDTLGRAEGAVGEAHARGAQSRRRRSITYEERLTSENVERILADGWDVIVDGADNFPTRYLVNDASVWHGIPVVHGSIYRFEGQVTVFDPLAGPCYRCLYPAPPPPELAPSCAEGGVLGVLPGHRRLAAGERGAEADPRRRRHAHRPAAPVRRPADDVRRGDGEEGSRLPRLRRVARRSPSTSTTSSSARGRFTYDARPDPPDASQRGRRRAPGRSRRRHRSRSARRPRRPLSRPGRAALRRR